MTREETAKLIPIMQHFVDGGEVEVAPLRHCSDGCYFEHTGNPMWSWAKHTYRKKQTKDEFTAWEILPPEYKWIARDSDGDAFAFSCHPKVLEGYWCDDASDDVMRVDLLTVFKRGTCDWKDSLIERPEKV